MRALPLVLPLLLAFPALSACAAPAAEGPTRDSEALARELAGRTAGAEENCISADQQTSLRIVDARTLVYDAGRTIWVNRLEASCPGMRPMDTLVVELHGSQYCRSDRFRAVSTGSSIPGPTCLLGRFTPYRR